MRTELLSNVENFDVVVTTYEMAASQNMKTMLCHRIHWRYLVLDEGHRIKNEKTGLFERLRLVKAQRKLLLAINGCWALAMVWNGLRDGWLDFTVGKAARMRQLLHDWYREVDAKFLRERDGRTPWRPF